MPGSDIGMISEMQGTPSLVWILLNIAQAAHSSLADWKAPMELQFRNRGNLLGWLGSQALGQEACLLVLLAEGTPGMVLPTSLLKLREPVPCPSKVPWTCAVHLQAVPKTTVVPKEGQSYCGLLTGQQLLSAPAVSRTIRGSRLKLLYLAARRQTTPKRPSWLRNAASWTSSRSKANRTGNSSMSPQSRSSAV